MASQTDRDAMTVTGPVPARELGLTLPHEHPYCDLSLHSGRDDNRVTDVGTMIGEMGFFRAAGGRTVVDLTSEGVGRDPARLREISEASGVQIVSGIAFYDRVTWPDWVIDASVEQIADYLVSQLEDGSDGVRAGLIGEILSHNEPEPNPETYRLRPDEVKLFQAAAQAQHRTGTGIFTHASLGRGGHAQLDVLGDAGADLTRVAIGHCDAHWHEDAGQDLAYYLPILERGAFCSFDMIGWRDFAPDEVRADRIATLVKMGYAPQLLLSTDTCRRSQLHANGGRGLDFLWNSFLPRLLNRGVGADAIETMTVVSPRRLLAGE